MLTILPGQFVFASNAGAIHCSLDAVSDHFRTIPAPVHTELKDSSATENRNEPIFLTARFEGLKSTFFPDDTIHKSSDVNLELYNKNALSTLKSRGESNFITRNLFSIIIRDSQPAKEQMGVNSSLYFAPFAGKQIVKIRIQQLDVFGPSLTDTLRIAKGWLERTANVIHMKTVEKKLRNQLLFKLGEKVNPQLMAENEKIIRDLPYIQDVAILLTNRPMSPDEVEILVITKERFEYAASGNASQGSSEFEIVDKNMFGIGHQLSAKMVYNNQGIPNWGGDFNYEINDLGGRFIKTGFGYTDTYRETGWNAYLDKQFIASKSDWAGGISLKRVFADYYLTPYSYTRLDSAVSYLNTDIWYGRQLKHPNFLPDIGNISIAARYLHQDFYGNLKALSANSFLRDHDFIIGSVGISKRYLFKNNKVYGYGITEDIPYGRLAEFALGVDADENKTRPYFHLRYSKANILNGGSYFKWQVGVGGYLNNARLEQGAIQLNTNYFTNYFYINHHPYRFFINMELLSGINRFAEEYLVINRRFGIRDFYSLETKGTNRLKLNIESVRFWGANNTGFRFANYFFADAAFLSNDLSTLLRDHFYAGIGFGIRVHNESLVFNVLELRFSWIPIAPKNYNPFVFNAFGQPKARFDDFLGGKPQEILYQ